ncbi:MAG: hypothetical protein WBX17_13070, partial [Microbacterium sp.]
MTAPGPPETPVSRRAARVQREEALRRAPRTRRSAPEVGMSPPIADLDGTVPARHAKPPARARIAV